MSVTLRCKIHNVVFTVGAECFMRGNDIRCSCPKCSEERSKIRYATMRSECECAYCGKKFVRSNSKTYGSKSGLYFCCRAHKDLAQKLNFGLSAIHPSHYGVCTPTVKTYRKLAFKAYAHKCAVCGWDDDEAVLEVHHIDEDRSNNNLDNLIILCPICHRKLTSHKYMLNGRGKIEFVSTTSGHSSVGRAHD